MTKMNIQPFLVSNKNWVLRVRWRNRRAERNRNWYKKKETKTTIGEEEKGNRTEVGEEGWLRSICRFGKLGVFKT